MNSHFCDLVDRLREMHLQCIVPDEPSLYSRAADVIEHLRSELERTRQAWANGDDPDCGVGDFGADDGRRSE